MLTSSAIQPTTNLRVAACFSGFPRNYANTFPYMKRHFFDTCSPDIFWAGFNEEEGVFDQRVIDLYQPKDYFFRDYNKDAIDEINKEFNNYQPTLVRQETKVDRVKSQFYNVYLANELKKKHEKENNFKYDIVIRCRPDYYYFRDLTIEELKLGMNGDVVIPDEWDWKLVSSYGVSDCFAYSSSKTMDIYSKVFYHFAEYNKPGNMFFHQETMLGYHLHKFGIKRIATERHFKYETPDGEDNERREHTSG